MTSVWGVSAVAILDSSVNCVCVWSTKKLPMPAYCVAANCNNSQTTPGITMHELPRNRSAVRRKWIKFIQFKRADFLYAPHHAHLCSDHFSECDFANPIEYRMSKLTRCSGTPSKYCLTGSDWYGSVSLWVSRAKYQFRLRSSSWPFCRDSSEWRSRHIWSRDLGFMATLSVRQKMPFFRAFITLRYSFTYIIVLSEL